MPSLRELIKSRTGHYDLDSVSAADLSKSSLRSMDGIQGLIACRALDLNGNEIQSIKQLSGLSGLTALDLSNNRIASIDSLRSLRSLKELRLQGNELKALRPVLDVLSSLPSLERVQLRSAETGDKNPCCDLPAYRSQLIAALPQARVIDGEVLLLTGAAEALALPPEPDLTGIKDVPGPTLSEMLDNEEARASGRSADAADIAAAPGNSSSDVGSGGEIKLRETQLALDDCARLDREAGTLLAEAAAKLGVAVTDGVG